MDSILIESTFLSLNGLWSVCIDLITRYTEKTVIVARKSIMASSANAAVPAAEDMPIPIQDDSESEAHPIPAAAPAPRARVHASAAPSATVPASMTDDA